MAQLAEELPEEEGVADQHDVLVRREAHLGDRQREVGTCGDRQREVCSSAARARPTLSLSLSLTLSLSLSLRLSLSPSLTLSLSPSLRPSLTWRISSATRSCTSSLDSGSADHQRPRTSMVELRV